MVRKASLFQKLFRKGQPAEEKKIQPVTRPAVTPLPAGARPAQPSRIGGGNGKGAPARPQVRAGLEADIRPEILLQPKPEPVKSEPRVEERPVRKEDAQKAVVTGLKDLSSLLTGIQGHMEDQGRRTGKLLEKFEDLPETARAQIQFLERISTQLETQHNHTSELLQKFGQIPDLLAGVQRILETQQAADERRDQTLGRFRDTMDRINGSIAALNQDSTRSIQETAQTFERSHASSVKLFERAQQQTLDAFQRSAEVQGKALGSILQGSTRQNRAILLFLALIFLAMTGVFITMLAGGAL